MGMRHDRGHVMDIHDRLMSYLAECTGMQFIAIYLKFKWSQVVQRVCHK